MGICQSNHTSKNFPSLNHSLANSLNKYNLKNGKNNIPIITK